MDKREELFCYFREGKGINGPLSWHKDGKRLYEVLHKTPQDKIDAMYDRCILLQKKAWYSRLWRWIND